MSLVVGASVFDATQLERYRPPYERMVYTAMDPALANLLTPIFSIQDVAVPQPSAVAILSGLGVTQTPGVNLLMAGNTNTTTQPTAGFPPALGLTETDEDSGLRSGGNLALTWQNTTGSALTSLQQVTYLGAVKQLTVADRILRGLPLAPAQQELAARYGLQAADGRLAGARVQTIAALLRQIYRQAIIEELIQTVYIPTVQAGQQPQLQITAQPRVVGEEVLVWHSLAAAVPSGSVGNGVVLTVYRDNQKPIQTLFLDNLSLTTSVRPWLPAQQLLQWFVSANTTTADVAFRVRWFRCRMTRTLQIALGLVPSADFSKADQALADQLQVGVG